MRGRDRRLDVGGIVFGAILLLVGGYFLLRNTFGFEIPDLDWDMIWPLLIIALGIGVLVGALRVRSGGEDRGGPSPT
jgi:uncharacterized integral membrane protein